MRNIHYNLKLNFLWVCLGVVLARIMSVDDDREPTQVKKRRADTPEEDPLFFNCRGTLSIKYTYKINQ